jgi:hypothetical protein
MSPLTQRSQSVNPTVAAAASGEAPSAPCAAAMRSTAWYTRALIRESGRGLRPLICVYLIAASLALRDERRPL